MENLFGRAYDSVGSSDSDLIIKTRGQVKIQWGNKFIDLIKNGKINCNSDITSEQVKKWLKLICPPGTIVQWGGLQVPEGWALCDGNNGTPNLIDKFIKASDSPGEVGGNKELPITVSSSPSYSYSLQEALEDINNGNITESTQTSYSNNYSYTINMSDNTSNEETINIEPQYYTLLYIMKLDY